MSLPPKVVTVLCSVQVFFIVAGYLITCWSLRMLDKLWMGNAPHISDLDFLRTFGPWCLLVPIAWGVFAMANARTDGGEASITGTQFFIGVGLTIVLVLVFSIGIVHSISLLFGGTRLS